MEEENDFYNIRKEWEEVKELVKENEGDVDKFLRKKGVNASVRFRDKLNRIRKLCVHLRESILLQRQDNYSQYD